MCIRDRVHSVVSPSGIHATISIGVGHDGSGFEEDFQFSSLAAEMALSRGGDPVSYTHLDVYKRQAPRR